MRRLFAILVVALVAVSAFVAGGVLAMRGRLPTEVKTYKAPDGRVYVYTDSPGNLGEFVVDKDFDGRPEHWTLIAQEDKDTTGSVLAHPQSSEWATNEAFYARQPAKAFDMAYWDDDGDELFDAFTFRLRGWCNGDACGGDGNVLLNVLDLDVDGYPETFSCTIFADAGIRGYNYSDIGFDGTWDLRMEYDGKNKQAFFNGTWLEIVGGSPMLSGLTVKNGNTTRKIIWEGGRFVKAE